MKISTLSQLLLTLLLCAIHTGAQTKPIAIIPKPVSMVLGQKQLKLPTAVAVAMDKRISHEKDALLGLLQEALGSDVRLPNKASGLVSLRLSPSIDQEEGYRLVVRDKGIDISAKTSLGLRHGIQSLAQLSVGRRLFQHATITDSPRFAYRGLMLDVSRHFMPVNSIKKLLNEMGRLKLNRFHWHLVDGGGWRMQSDNYPLLTKLSAFRTERDWDKWWHARDRRFVPEGTPGSYGGYYTKKEIADVVQHATRLGITIIPEIELPGHSNELFYSYRDLLCPNASAEDATDVCIGSEATFTFFEKILDETMALFPSKYIHIGGDEAAMNYWGKCPRCQKRMKEENLRDLHELQSYMIRRIEKYLNHHGRKLIGWDEILLGGLAPDATVMSWRGEDGGISAARAGHDVIMTPNNFLYLDYYQSDAIDAPRAIGGYVPLEKVYAYNPTPKALTSAEQKHIIGVQANVWTEYIASPEHLSYMVFPRALALAEVAWSPQKDRDYTDFRRRATSWLPMLMDRGHTPYPLSGITVSDSISTSGDKLFLRLKAERSDAELRYTTNGTSPNAQSTLYTPETILSTSDSLVVTANVFFRGEKLNQTDKVFRIDRHKGLKSTVHYNSKWNAKYPANKVETLKDGHRGSPTYMDGKWQGFTEPMDVTFELDSPQLVRRISARFMAEREQWVYMPRSVEVLTSLDGLKYSSIGQLSTLTSDDNPKPVFETFDFYTNERIKFVRIIATIGRSEGHFIFCDEVVIH